MFYKRYPFPFAIAELIYKVNEIKTDRFGQLTFLIATQVATAEEQAEYAKAVRPEVEKAWDKIVEEDLIFKKKQISYFNNKLDYHRKSAIYFRKIGEFDLANKREELIFFMEKKGPFDYFWGDISLQGFIQGWGDAKINSPSL
jgi:hypothetical protein